MSIPFCKFHGFGNDYIVIEKADLPENTKIDELAKAVCDRHKGAGSDGIALIWPHDGEDADFGCAIVNPDGSIAGFSGNGTRCAVAYLYYKEKWGKPGLRLSMSTGIKNYRLIERLSPGHCWFEAEIGKPKFAAKDIPFRSIQDMKAVVDQNVVVGSQALAVSAVNVGNPVACIFVPNFDLDWRSIGKEMESNPAFPERTNVVFINVLDKENIDVRIWERGAGETASSGTCCSAAAVMSAYTGRTSRNVSVFSEGGTTEIYWRADDEILITGRADLAFCGIWPV